MIKIKLLFEKIKLLFEKIKWHWIMNNLKSKISIEDYRNLVNAQKELENISRPNLTFYEKFLDQEFKR